MAKVQVSNETQTKVSSFEQADAAYKAAWDAFETAHKHELESLDKLREDRNAKLDEAIRSLREEAVSIDITLTKRIDAGPLYVQKKWSSFYVPKKLVSELKDHNLFDSALASGIVEERIDVADYEKVKDFLEKSGVAQDFEDCEDGKELTPAVYGPKPIPPFGAEAKERKK